MHIARFWKRISFLSLFIETPGSLRLYPFCISYTLVLSFIFLFCLRFYPSQFFCRVLLVYPIQCHPADYVHQSKLFMTNIRAISALDIIFLCYLIYFLSRVFRNILMIQLLIRNTRLILALAIPTSATITVVNKQRETPLFASEKTSRVLSVVIYLLSIFPMPLFILFYFIYPFFFIVNYNGILTCIK